MPIYICTSKYGVVLEWDIVKSKAIDAFNKAGDKAKLELLKDGVRKTLKTKA